MECCTHDYVMFYKAPFASRLAALEEASCCEVHSSVGEAPMQDSVGSLQELRVAFSKKLKPSVL